MGALRTPRGAADRAETAPSLPPGNDERISGYGVMGLSFDSGDYLVLRCMTAASFGPGYRAVWHRSSAGDWTVYSTQDPEHSCERYIGAACSHPSVRTEIDVEWRDERTLHVHVGDRLEWTVALHQTVVTRMFSVVGAVMPRWMWRRRVVLGVMGWMAGLMLGVGSVRLTGAMPNGQRYVAAPEQIWAVQDSRATLAGRLLGTPTPLPTQAAIGDFWLPQHGIFMRGFGLFDPFDPARHVSGAARQRQLLEEAA
jgi:hypothetical protein